MDSLFRLIHVSDFHFGNNLFPQGNLHSYSGHVTVSVHPLEIHDLSALEALSNSFHWTQGISKTPGIIVVTGDLTSFGTVTAFELAFRYLRNLIDVGGGQKIGFNDPNVNVVPGNHDIWGAATLNPVTAISSSSSTRVDFDRCCNLPSPLAIYPRGSIKFPYRLELHNSPLIYLYGLDSNRLDTYTGLQVPSLLADGFVDDQQLIDIEFLVNSEPATPRLRIAALHHFLKRPQARAVSFPKGKLLNPDEVVSKLQQLGFALVLCGHLHEGFIETIQSSTTIYLLACGSSAQKVNLSNDEKNVLLTPSILLNQQNRKLRQQAIRRTNEYRIYEFATDTGNPSSLSVSIHRYVYVPKRAAFDEQTSPINISL